MLGSVRGVVSNDHSYRDKDQTSQGPRVFIRSKATCAALLCEVLSPCRSTATSRAKGSYRASALPAPSAARSRGSDCVAEFDLSDEQRRRLVVQERT